MSSKSDTSTAPVFHKFSELVIDPILSGRSPKEIRENAKSLAKEMQAHGEWDSMQPGQVFLGEDDKLHVCAGFTRIAAAQSLEWKGGYFFEVPKVDPIEIRLKCITTNGGKPVSRMEQGKVFAALQNGVVSDDFAGSVADPKNVKDWKVQPMTFQEIADKIGKSGEHVRQCIMLNELENEGIKAMIEADEISTNVIVVAMGWAKKNENLALRILKAAQKEANGEKVTKKHLDAVKADLVKEKAIVTKSKKGATSAADKEDQEGGDEDEGGSDAGVDNKDEQDGKESQETPSLNLGEPAPSAPKPPTKAALKTIRDTLLTVILETDAEIDDDLAQRLADRLIDAKLIVNETPF